jgi:hypothetical protein
MNTHEQLKDKLAYFGGYKWLPYIDAVELVEENQRLRKNFKSRGLEIIDLQNKLIKQGEFYEGELQKAEKEIEKYRLEVIRLYDKYCK